MLEPLLYFYHFVSCNTSLTRLKYLVYDFYFIKIVNSVSVIPAPLPLLTTIMLDSDNFARAFLLPHALCYHANPVPSAQKTYPEEYSGAIILASQICLYFHLRFRL